jgi:hypothetical protein
MWIPEDVLRCVCFLHSERTCKPESVVGTGFFVQIDGKNWRNVYLVTARHVLYTRKDRYLKNPRPRWARVHDLGSDEPMIVGINDAWVFADDENGVSIDAAVVPFSQPPESGIGTITDPAFMTDEKMERFHIGYGDELSVVGLFSPRPGDKNVLPIVRSGIIAALPGEPVESERNGQLHRVYLAELRSWGGLSGSPVFVNLGYDRQADGDLNETGETPLLGLLSGHYGLERSDPKKNPAMALYRPDELNMGIARVTPWGDVMKILNGDKLTRMRAERDAQAPSQQVVLDDIIARKIPGVEVTKLTKAEFEAALRKVSRRLVPKKNGG